MGKPEKIRVIGRPVGRWKNIKMYLKQTDLEGMDWINVAQDRDNLWAIVKMVVKLQIPNMRGIPSIAKESVSQSVSQSVCVLPSLISNFIASNSNFSRVLTAQSVICWKDVGPTQGLTVHTIKHPHTALIYTFSDFLDEQVVFSLQNFVYRTVISYFTDP